MGRAVLLRTIIEKAPSHNGAPCFTAWEKKESPATPNTPVAGVSRPKWSIQIYDTRPNASDPDHVQAIADKIHTMTLNGRRTASRGAPDRIEIHGLPLVEGTTDDERAAACINHQKAEITARTEAKDGDFLMPPTWNHRYWRRIVLICQPEAQWDQKGSFLDVQFDPLPQQPTLSGLGTSALKEVHIRRFTGADLEEKLCELKDGAESLNSNYVQDGQLNEEWSWDFCKLGGHEPKAMEL